MKDGTVEEETVEGAKTEFNMTELERVVIVIIQTFVTQVGSSGQKQ